MYIRNAAGSKGTSNSVYRRPAKPKPVRQPPRKPTQFESDAYAEHTAGLSMYNRLQGPGGAGPVNPAMDLFATTPPWGGGGGGGGRGRGRGSGGGGGRAGVSADQKAAYQKLMDSYSTDQVGKPFDTASKAVSSASQAGLDRLAPIMADLGSRAAQGRTAVNDAYGQGDARLAALQAQYQAAAGGANNGLDQVMNAFGASPVQDTGAQSLLNLFANSRMANDRARTVNDAGMADRPSIYAGLNADVKSGMNRDQSALNAKIAMERLQAERAAAQQAAQLQAELAQMGIKL